MSIRPEHLFLHIGMPKAASTAMQAWFHQHHFTLLREHGLWYPHRTDHPEDGHRFLAQELREDPSFPILSQTLAQPKAAKILLSREGLYTQIVKAELFRDRLHKLRQKLDGIDRTVILITRDPDAWAKSLYKHRVLFSKQKPKAPQQANWHSFEQFRQLDTIKRMEAMEANIPLIKEALGTDHVIHLRMDTPGWFPSLLDQIGLGAVKHLELPYRNPARPDWIIKVMLQANARYRIIEKRYMWCIALLYFIKDQSHLFRTTKDTFSKKKLQTIDLGLLDQVRAAEGADLTPEFDQNLKDFATFIKNGLPEDTPEDTRGDGPKETQ